MYICIYVYMYICIYMYIYLTTVLQKHISKHSWTDP